MNQAASSYQFHIARYCTSKFFKRQQKRGLKSMNGFFNIFKPRGKTSHDVVGIARRILHEKKIGHSGTLDPDTDGVLPIAAGKSTRLIDFLPSNKSYRFEMIFGFENDTGD